jgi:SAM-dependent methyltransferase
MGQTSITTTSPQAAPRSFARQLRGIPNVSRPGSQNGLSAASLLQSHFWTGQPRLEPTLTAPESRSDQRLTTPSPRQSRAQKEECKTMNTLAATNLVRSATTRGYDAPQQTAAARLQAQLHLPAGEAFDSLLSVHKVLGAELPNTPLNIYEAGGGSTCFLPTDVVRRANVTVVDIDEEQLRNNDYADRTILGDIQTYRFSPRSFDLVICYNVLEHVPDVEATLDGFFQSLKQGGLVLIAAPNPKSLSGVVTKYTPHWFHVWFYRHVLGKKRAGLPGQSPFPTFFHRLVTPANLVAFAKKHGMQVVYRREHESPRFPEMRAGKPLLAGLLDTFAKVVNRLLPGDFDMRRGDYHLILQKPKVVQKKAKPVIQLVEGLAPAAGAATRSQSLPGVIKALSFADVVGRNERTTTVDADKNGHSLNGLFPISVNSPSMSMVNVSCCVGSAPDAASRVTEKVTPQPMRAAVRMEAGDHASL